MSMAREYNMLKSIISEKRKEINKLENQKKAIGERLYQYMKSKSIENYQGIHIDEIKPKTRAKKPPKKEREEAAITRLRQVGIPNPRALLTELDL